MNKPKDSEVQTRWSTCWNVRDELKTHLGSVVLVHTGPGDLPDDSTQDLLPQRPIKTQPFQNLLVAPGVMLLSQRPPHPTPHPIESHNKANYEAFGGRGGESDGGVGGEELN